MKQNLKSGFVQNSLWMIAGKIAQMLIALVIGVISARYLGPSNYGLINYGASYTALFTPITTLGLTGIIVNELVANPTKEGAILGSAIGMRIASALVSSVCIVLIIYCLNPSNELLLAVTALQCVSILFQWSDLFNYWCQSKYISKTAVTIQLASYLMTSTYKVWLLAAGKDVRWFALSMGIDYFLQAIGYLGYFNRHGTSKLQFNSTEAICLLRKSYHFIFAALASVIYNQIDRVMLGSMMDTTAVGLYTAAYTLTNVWTFVLSAIIDSIRPLIIMTRGENYRLYKTRMINLYSIVIYLCIIVSIGMTLLSKVGLMILYGKEYLPAASTVGILTWATMFSFLGVARSIWSVCENKQKYEKYLTIVGAITNVILNSLLIPVWGIYGAAIATLVSQAVTNFIVAFFISDMRENSMFILAAFNPKNLPIGIFIMFLRRKSNGEKSNR